MEANRILAVEITPEYGSEIRFEVTVLETAGDAAKRYAREVEQYERFQQEQHLKSQLKRERVIEEAKKLGMQFPGG